MMHRLIAAAGPSRLLHDFNHAKRMFKSLPTHAVMHKVGLGKRVLTDLCSSAIHGEKFTFLAANDAVAVRLSDEHAVLYDLATMQKV